MTDSLFENWIHIPTPGDHYSPATGSALMTIIYELSRVHVAAGGRSRVVVGRTTRPDRYAVGRVVEVDAAPGPKRWQKALDVAAGRIGLPRRFSALPYRGSAKALTREETACVFVHNNPAPIPMLRRRCPKARICLWANNVLWKTYSPMEVRRVAEIADRLICCSRYIASDTVKRLPKELHAKVGVVHNGVDPDRFIPASKTERGPAVVLFVGRVVSQKGAHLLIEAARQLDAAGVDGFQVRIVGSSGFTADGGLSPYEEGLRTQAEPLGEKVHFVPFRDRAAVREEFAGASIFCVPSDWDDPCPLTVLEGMACGLPVVGSRRGGIPEELGPDGLLFDTSDPAGLAGQLKRLLDSPRHAEEVGTAMRRRVEESFCWTVRHRALQDVILGGRGDLAEMNLC